MSMRAEQPPGSGDPVKPVLRGLRGVFLVIGAFSLFINMAMLVTPLYMMQVYDRVLTSRSKDTLIVLTVLAIGLLVFSALVEVARSRLLVRAGSRFDRALSEGLFGRAFQARLDGSDRSASQPLRDLETVRSFLSGAGIIALFDAPWTPIYLAAIFLLHPVLGLIAVAGAVVLIALALISDAAANGPLRQAGAGARSSNDLTDLLARNAEAVHAMGMLDGLRKRWLKLHLHGVAWQAIASDRIGILQAIAKMVRLGLQVAILFAGAWLAIDNQMSPGAMIAASIIMGRALAPVESLIGQWRNLINAREARARLAGAAPEARAGETAPTRLPAPKGRLNVAQVSLRIEGVSAPIVSNVSFDLKPGEALGVIGPSGAGKSTLARLLVGLWQPSAGSVRLDGVEIATWPKADIGPYLGYLPQDVELLTGTVAENIARFTTGSSEAIVRAAQLAGAHETILALPQGYETPVGDAGRLLSGGQRQRLALARAVYGDVRFLVLDEPNANLDSDGEQALRRALTKLRDRGRTIVVVSHKPSVLNFVDKLLVLQAGRVAMFGSSHQVMAAMNSENVAPLRRPETAAGTTV